MGGTTGSIVGTILIPVPILGATIGGVVGSVGGKLIGGVSGIALSKILEVYEKIKAAKIKKMVALPQLMMNISPESEMMRGLMGLAFDHDEEKRIATAVEEAIESKATSNSLYPSLDEFTSQSAESSQENYRKARALTTELMSDENSVDYFVLTPVPDENAPEEFASSTDLLVLRWPIDMSKPWDTDGEKVLDINEMTQQSS